MKNVCIAAVGLMAGMISLSFANSESTTLSEIVVTSTADKSVRTVTGSKTDTALKYIPSNIGIINADLIKAQGSSNLDQTIKNVSGVTQSSSSNYGFFNNYLIHGMNMNFLRDGAPDASTVNGYSRSLTNVERVEVLKGPGSALYGSGSPGGSVNLISKSPQEKAAYSVSQLAGSFDTYQTSVDLTGPLVNKELLYRLNSSYYTSVGFRDLNKKSVEVLPSVLWHVNDDHQVQFDFDYRRIELVADTNGIPFQGASLTQENALLDVSRSNKYYTPFGETNQDIFRMAIKDEQQLTDSVLLRNNLIFLDRNLYLLRNAGGTVAAGSQVMTGRGLREQSDDVKDYIYQLEPVVDFETGFLGHKLLTGFEAQYHDIQAVRSTASLPNILNVYNPIIPETSKSSLTFTKNFDRDIKAMYQSLYAQDQIEITEQWKARVGARSDWFDTKDKNAVNGQDQHRRDNEVSTQAGLVYEPIKNVSFYTGLSNSKQAILSTESSLLGQPEGAEQVEVGNKTTWFDDKLSLNVSLYKVTRHNFLVNIGTDTVPVGKQRTQGLDVDLSAEPLPGWKMYSNYAFQQAKLVSVQQPAGNPGVDGNEPVGIPQHSLGMWSTYELQEGRLKGFGFGGGVTFKDSIFINLQNTSRIPSYVTGDLVFFYHQDRYEAQLNISNIGDAVYYRNGVNSGALPGDPLTVQGIVKVHF